MIGDSATPAKRPWIVALEDAIVIFAFVLIGGLISSGSTWPPNIQVLYASALTAALAGILSWAKARNVPLPQPVAPPPQ